MRSKYFLSVAFALLLSLSASSWAHYWRLEGLPEFSTTSHGEPAAKVGETRITSEGLTVTLVARSFNSAEFISVSPRWGAHRMRLTWDTPPEVIQPGGQFSTAIRWDIMQRWSDYSPQVFAMSHLDWSNDFYTRPISYGYNQPTDLKANQGSDRNSWTVTTNDSGELTYYTAVRCSGIDVTVNWKYRKFDGEAQVSTAGAGMGANAGAVPGPALEGPWSINGRPTFIGRGSTDPLVFINEGGASSRGRFADANTVIAIDWVGGLRGSVQDGGTTIRWANGTVWTRANGSGSGPTPGNPTAQPYNPGAQFPALEGAWAFNGRPTTVSRGNPDPLVFTNEGGASSRGRFADANTVIAIDWEGGLRGSIQDGGNTIRWGNGTVWNRAHPGGAGGPYQAPMQQATPSHLNGALTNFALQGNGGRVVSGFTGYSTPRTVINDGDKADGNDAGAAYSYGNEAFKVVFARPVNLQRIGLQHRSSGGGGARNILARARIIFDNGSSQEVQFAPTYNMQYVNLIPGVTGSVTVEPLGFHPRSDSRWGIIEFEAFGLAAGNL